MEKHKSEECCMMVRSSRKRKRKQHSKIYVLWLDSFRADVGTEHQQGNRWVAIAPVRNALNTTMKNGEKEMTNQYIYCIL